MYMTRFALAALVALGLAACDGAGGHNSPDGEEGSTGSGAPATSNDSLVTGEAIQTVPPPAENAEPTATETMPPAGGTPQGAAVPPAPSGGAADTSTVRP